MNKEQFLARIRDRLAALPPEDLESSLDYYREMIEDRMEEGLTEEEAVAAMGPADQAAARVLAESPRPQLPPEPPRARVRKGWKIAAAAAGSPIWLPLLIAAAAVLLAVYAVIWAVVISLYAADLALAAGALAGLAGFAAMLFIKGLVPALFYLGAALICAGLAILLFFGCNWLSRMAVKLARLTAHGIKASFIRKGDAK